ncbi:MAG: phage antirepressor KilAC domain-containing protein, partial [Synergistaceae bacterium]|nr:phage antirepressor KilAC domain-containing protein [Synergistaceae bacterium]
DAFIQVLQAYKAEREKRESLEAKIEEDKPKLIFAEAVNTSKESILIGNLAKVLRQNGVEIGQNRLFEWLRENGFLIKCKGERWNMPTQDSIERGLFEVKTRVINNPDGTTRIVRTTKVTGKGQIYFVNRFLKGNLE